MKSVITSTIVLLYAVTIGATQQTPDKTTDRMYTSPDGVFRFTYPAFLKMHSAPGNENAICQGNLVCAEWPFQYIYRGYDFAGAGFWVGVATQRESMAKSPTRVVSERDCLTFHTYSQPVTSITINGVRFSTISRGGAAAGTTTDSRLFRSFHHGICYELGTAISVANGGYTDEDYASGKVKRFTRGDESIVEKRLDAVVKSFRFLK